MLIAVAFNRCYHLQVDPTDSKPADWDDRVQIPNPKVSKPPSWDETLPKHIPDPNAVPPADWYECQRWYTCMS
jgi:hypothetical protein